MTLPFDGGISRFYNDSAPKDVRTAIQNAQKGQILNPDYPYAKRMSRWIDVEGLNRWDAYTTAINDTLARTHTDTAPWVVVRSDDKRRARLNTIRSVLHDLDYAGRNDAGLGKIDTKVVGAPTHG